MVSPRDKQRPRTVTGAALLAACSFATLLVAVTLGSAPQRGSKCAAVLEVTQHRRKGLAWAYGASGRTRGFRHLSCPSWPPFWAASCRPAPRRVRQAATVTRAIKHGILRSEHLRAVVPNELARCERAGSHVRAGNPVFWRSARAHRRDTQPRKPCMCPELAFVGPGAVSSARYRVLASRNSVGAFASESSRSGHPTTPPSTVPVAESARRQTTARKLFDLATPAPRSRPSGAQVASTQVFALDCGRSELHLTFTCMGRDRPRARAAASCVAAMHLGQLHRSAGLPH